MAGPAAERQEALLAAARQWVGDRLSVAPSAAVMHLVAWLREGVDDEPVSVRAEALGVEAPALSRYALERPARGGLVLGYAGYNPEAIESAMQQLARALE